MDLSTLLMVYSTNKDYLEKSAFYISFCETLKRSLIKWKDEKLNIKCYGLGNPTIKENSRFQLGLIDLICQNFVNFNSETTFFYDPGFNCISKTFLKLLNFKIPENDHNCDGVIESNTFVIFFHCSPYITKNLFLANWHVANLSKIILYSNSWNSVYNTDNSRCVMHNNKLNERFYCQIRFMIDNNNVVINSIESKKEDFNGRVLKAFTLLDLHYFLEHKLKLIAPSFWNLQADLEKIRFLSTIDLIPPNGDNFAFSGYKYESVAHISKIFDQYKNVICLENDLFLLHDDKTKDMSYSSINSPDKTDQEIESIINSIVDGLFSVCVTMGTLPIIRCPQGNAAEMVAKKLDKKLKDHLRETRNTLFSGFKPEHTSYRYCGAKKMVGLERPLLVILDRIMDVATPLLHSSTYQALIHDILGLEFNSTTVPSSNPEATTYELWSENDEFWRDERHKSLPEIANILKQGLEVIKSKEKEMTQLKTSMGISGDTDTVSSLKPFLDKKKMLGVHTSIATYLADQIKERKLDIYYELEERLQAKQMLQDKTVLDMLSSTNGNPKDKLRLLLLAILYGCGSPSNSLKEITDQELDQMAALIHQADPSLAVTESIKYVRNYLSHTRMNVNTGQSYGQAKTGRLFAEIITNSQQEGVKNFVAKKHKLPFTRIVHNLMDQNVDKEIDNYNYFDPAFNLQSDGEAVPRNKSPFQQAVVFVVGGGTYVEYQNLQEYCKPPEYSYKTVEQKYVSYGCTELYNGDQFLSQLMDLVSRESLLSSIV